MFGEYEPGCDTCREDGFANCQGHLYDTQEEVYLPISVRQLNELAGQ